VDVASGSRDDRPELQRLLRDAQRGGINACIVTRLDRLSRSSAHGAQLLRYFQQPGSPNLIALDDSLDLSTPGGRFMARLLISWAEAESDRLAERVRHGAAYRRSKLQPLGRQAPFGYQFTADRSNIERHPEHWAIAKQLVEHFLQTGNTAATIELSKQLGVAWGSNFSLRRWLSNPSLTGARVYGGCTYTVDKEGKKKRIDNPPGIYREVHPDCHHALITTVEHAKIIATFHANALTPRRQLMPDRVRICSGLVRCDHCGHNMISRMIMTKQPYVQLRCQHPQCDVRTKNNIKEEQVVAYFLVAVSVVANELAMNIGELEAVSSDQPPAGLKEVQEEIANLRKVIHLPGIPQLLAAAQARLELLVAGDSMVGSREDFMQRAEAFSNLEVLSKVADDDPKGMRVLFERYLTATVGNGKVLSVTVAPELRRPESDGVLRFGTAPA